MFLSTCNRVEVFAAGSAPTARTARSRARSAQSVRVRRARRAPTELEPVPLRAHGDGRRAPRLPRRGEPRLDGARRAADPRPGEGRVRRGDRGGHAAALPRALHAPRVHRRQARADRDRARRGHGQHQQRRGRPARKGIFGDLADHAVLLLGAGEMAEAAAKSLGKGARHIRVCNRSFDARRRARRAASAATPSPWDALEDELVRADVVVASTGEPDLRGDARPGEARDEGAEGPDAVLHRHRRSAQRRAERCTRSTTSTSTTSTTSSSRSPRP